MNNFVTKKKRKSGYMSIDNTCSNNESTIAKQAKYEKRKRCCVKGLEKTWPWVKYDFEP